VKPGSEGELKSARAVLSILEAARVWLESGNWALTMGVKPEAVRVLSDRPTGTSRKESPIS
jgi:hypothetical protein